MKFNASFGRLFISFYEGPGGLSKKVFFLALFRDSEGINSSSEQVYDQDVEKTNKNGIGVKRGCSGFDFFYTHSAFNTINEIIYNKNTFFSEKSSTKIVPGLFFNRTLYFRFFDNFCVWVSCSG